MFSYTFNSVTSVKVGSNTLSASDYTINGMTISIPANKINGNVVINVATTAVNNPDIPDTPDTPDTGTTEDTGVILATWNDYSIEGFVRPAGTISTSAGYKRTDYIDISQYNFNKIKAYTNPESVSVSPIVFFNAEKIYISGLTAEEREGAGNNGYSYADWHEMEVPENAAYVMSACLASKPSDKSLVQVIGYTN